VTVPAADFIVIGIAEPSEGTFWKPALVLATAAGEGIRYVGRVATSRGCWTAMKHGRIASAFPCSAAKYCATTLVLRHVPTAPGTARSR